MSREDVIRNAEIVVKHLKQSEKFKYLVAYFKLKKEETMRDAMKVSGNITQEDLIKYNSQMIVYEDLENIDKLILNDLEL